MNVTVFSSRFMNELHKPTHLTVKHVKASMILTTLMMMMMMMMMMMRIIHRVYIREEMQMLVVIV